MPSYKIHLAIAHEISRKLEKSRKKFAKNDFVFGNILPDLSHYMIADCDEKTHAESHFQALDVDTPNLIVHPDLAKFLSETRIVNDVELGYFSHLLSDYFWNMETKKLFGEKINREKQHDFAKFNREISEIDIPKYDESLLEKSVEIRPITDVELREVVDYFENRHEDDDNPDDGYILFREEQLRDIFARNIDFVLENFAKYELLKNKKGAKNE